MFALFYLVKIYFSCQHPILLSTLFNKMLESSCISTDECSNMYHCSEGVCIHDDIFPLSVYSIVVYSFTGLMAAFCNISGNSMGIFKILILMMLLNYQLDQATGLAQALVVGTALPNFISVIVKKHPNGLSSLVNYKLLAIIIPCSLLGSTIGALTQTLIPKVAQISLIVLVFSFFVFTFAKKLKHSKVGKSQKQALEDTLIETAYSLGNPAIQQYNKQKQQILDYEKSYHGKQILLSVSVFLVFQVLSFLVQGKLPFYSIDKCSIQFPIGFTILFGVTLIYIFVLRQAIKRVFNKYRKHSIQQDIYLDGQRQFYVIVAGAFAAGVIQGILGMGCGTCIMMVLLSFPINSTSASATSGYQILFTGTASLLEYYMNGQVKTFESLWMMGVCCVIGGITTLILYWIINKLNKNSVNRFLYLIILLLCLMSIGLTVPTVLRIINKDGWGGMTSVTFHC